jgi:hypothetical protein
MSRKYYQAVVYSRSTLMDGGAIINIRCGHKHKTELAACRCLHAQQHTDQTGKTVSARWYNNTGIVDQDDAPVGINYELADGHWRQR